MIIMIIAFIDVVMIIKCIQMVHGNLYLILIKNQNIYSTSNTIYFTTYSCADNQFVGATIITKWNSNNIFDHFYWLTNNSRTQ